MDRTKLKRILDKFLMSAMLDLLDRKANKYQEHGFEKQAKKIRGFKKEVKKFGGTL
tara:strand:+ start:1094 stop:1261 length:168 start_codon:yes stop_codon:yes gene_type:complete